MPYNFEYEKVDSKEKKRFTEDDNNFLASTISSKWDEWDMLRSPNLQAILDVEKAIYPSYRPSNSKINISMPEIYEIRETYKAHLWKSWFSSLDSMFDVQGKTRIDQNNAVKQKASLINAFRSTELVSKLERGIDNWINKGEFIAFVSWTTKIKQIRKRDLRGGSLQGDAGVCAEGYSFSSTNNGGISYGCIENQDVSNNADFVPSFRIENEIVYDGPDITIVNPEAFVFDPAKKENFETCSKIYRSWATVDEIQANLLYKNTESLAEIPARQATKVSEARACKGDQLEILEFWGDVKLADGTVLKNYVVTLAGRKNIIRFEPNPFIINPFVYAAFLEDPETKRGYSPLYVGLSLNNASETILNLQLDALKLIINKPYLAPKGALSGKINIKEGAIIEYDPSLMPNQPIPLDFKDALVGWDFLRFFESKIESTTGIFKYMIGNPSAGGQKTATEASGLMAGQNIRLSKEIDVLNYRVKIPLIKKIAELMANFSFDVNEIKITNSNGDMDFVAIDESIRQGNYDYLIGDSNAAFEKKTRLKESIELIFQMAKQPEVAPKIKWIEVMKWAFGQIGSVDPNMFISEEQTIKQNGL
jgi:hypothetical protein